MPHFLCLFYKSEILSKNAETDFTFFNSQNLSSGCFQLNCLNHGCAKISMFCPDKNCEQGLIIVAQGFPGGSAVKNPHSGFTAVKPTHSNEDPAQPKINK